MFIALERIDRETGGLIKRIYNRMVRPRVWLNVGECLGGRYAVLRVETAGDRVDWASVERLCGSYGKRLLLPEGLSPPEESGLEQPRLPAFNRRVLLNTACRLVEDTRMPMYRRVLGLVDPGGLHTDLLYELLMHYTAVKVVTENKDAYREESARVMRELGAPVLLAEDFSSFTDCVLVLSPSAVLTEREASFRCPVLAGDTFVATGRFELFSELRAGAVEVVREACPTGISLHAFAGALQEYCGVEASSCVAEELLVNYKRSTLQEAVTATARLAGLDSPYMKSR